MIAILDAVTDLPIRNFLDVELAEAVVFVLFECPPDAEVFQGADVTHTSGVPAAQWVQEVELPYAGATVIPDLLTV